MSQEPNDASSTFFRIAAASGFLAVALGAFGAHGLRAYLDAARLATWETAVQYQMFHVVALLAIALLLQRRSAPALLWSGWSFALGSLLFSGSLYVLALTGLRWLGMITPLGGVCFLLGWGLLFKAASSKQ